MAGEFDTAHKRSIENPEEFWGEVAADIHWDKPWDRVLDDSAAPIYRWFAGAELNTCYNALDRHVEDGRADQAALIYDSPVTGTVRTYSYRELRDLTAAFAGGLAAKGVTKGDRVIIYMPMVPEAVIAILACARIGAVHSVVFGGFAANELAVRLNDCAPKAIISGSCGIEPDVSVEYKPLLDQAIELATSKPDFCVVLQREQATATMIDGRDHDWNDFITSAPPHPCVPVKATDPLYILYTSGTTGQPKGIVRDNGGHAVALKWSMKAVYNIEPGEVYWAASDIGWVVGHSYIIYGPLLQGATSVMYEGKPVGTPDAGAFWRVIEQHGVVTMFTAPTAFRAIRQQDPKGELLKKYDLSKFRILFLAGERCDPDTLKWAEDTLKVPVIDHWWQTETGWSIAANCMGIEPLPVKPGSPTRAVPGWDISIMDPETHETLPPGQIGAIVGKLPMPPSSAPTIWNAPERFNSAYLEAFPGYYETGDAGIMDEDGYIFVMARTDDIINVAGHRLSTGGMEEVLAEHPDVAECAVIGVSDDLKGQLPVGFMVLSAGTETPHETVVADVVKMVRQKIGPVAAFKHAVVIKRLPKPGQGKS